MTVKTFALTVALVLVRVKGRAVTRMPSFWLRMALPFRTSSLVLIKQKAFTAWVSSSFLQRTVISISM